MEFLAPLRSLSDEPPCYSAQSQPRYTLSTMANGAGKLGEHVISVSADNFHILHGTEVEEVRGTVNFMVELFRIGQL